MNGFGNIRQLAPNQIAVDLGNQTIYFRQDLYSGNIYMRQAYSNIEMLIVSGTEANRLQITLVQVAIGYLTNR